MSIDAIGQVEATTRPFRALLAVPAFLPAAAALFLSTLAQAMAGSYLALFAVTRVGMSPLELSGFLTASAVSGIIVTSVFGSWVDRRHSAVPLLLSLFGVIAGYGLLALTTDKMLLLVIALVPMGLAVAAFPLIFAAAKNRLDSEDGELAARGMAALRTLSSLAWAVGPALAALLITYWSYPGVFFGAALCGVLALVAMRAVPALPGTSAKPAAVDPGHSVFRLAWPAATMLTLFMTAMFMGSNAMSIVTVRELSGSEADVGLLFSLCAAIEVLVMAVFIVRPLKRAGRGLVLIGLVVFAAYFLANLIVPSLTMMYLSQLLRAVGIAMVSVIGMQYLQELMPTRSGAAAALYANAGSVGWIVSALATGAWAQAFGYWSIFGLCAATLIAAAVLFQSVRQFRL